MTEFPSPSQPGGLPPERLLLRFLAAELDVLGDETRRTAPRAAVLALLLWGATR